MLVAYARSKRVAQLLCRGRAQPRTPRAPLRGHPGGVWAKPRSIESPALGEPVADRSRDLRPFFGERHRLWVDVPIHRHDAERAQAACELSLQVPRPQDGQAARGELLALPGRTRVGRRWRPGTSPPPARRRSRFRGRRRRSRPCARAARASRPRRTSCASRGTCRRLPAPAAPPCSSSSASDPLGRSAKVVQLAP